MIENQWHEETRKCVQPEIVMIAVRVCSNTVDAALPVIISGIR